LKPRVIGLSASGVEGTEKFDFSREALTLGRLGS